MALAEKLYLGQIDRSIDQKCGRPLGRQGTEGLEYTLGAREMLTGAMGSEHKKASRAQIHIRMLPASWKRQQLICLYTSIKHLAFCLHILHLCPFSSYSVSNPLSRAPCFLTEEKKKRKNWRRPEILANQMLMPSK